MKKYLVITFLILLSFVSNLSFAEETTEIDQKLSTIGLFPSTEIDNKKAIEKLFSNQTKYSNSHNLKKLETLYADKYSNFDGLTRDDFLKMVTDTWNLYSELKYETIIKDISVTGSYADVEVVETAKGKTKSVCETTKKTGNIASTSNIIYHLEKFGKTWKIVSDNTIKEQTYLLYGEANNISMDLYSPTQVAGGAKYNVMFDIKVPKGYFVLASITNEEIVYPQKQPKEVFRNLKQDTALEREITANKNLHNEYAIASIGLTKPSISEDNKIHINVVGIGFLMNRVNVLPLRKGN